jgi:hypothetical protein
MLPTFVFHGIVPCDAPFIVPFFTHQYCAPAERLEKHFIFFLPTLCPDGANSSHLVTPQLYYRLTTHFTHPRYILNGIIANAVEIMMAKPIPTDFINTR